jgi:hypothetical protein
MARILENLVRDKWVDTRPGMIWPGTSMTQYDRIWVQADLKHESCTQNAEARPVWSVSSWSFTSRDSTAQNLLMVCIKSSREPYLTSLHTPTGPRHAAPTLLLRHSVTAAVRSIRFAAPYRPPHLHQTAQLLRAQPHRPPRLLCTAPDNMMSYLVFLTSGKIIKKNLPCSFYFG